MDLDLELSTYEWILFGLVIVAWYVHDKYVQRDHQFKLHVVL